jgi:DNA-nicking Smr family endonuclease
VTDRSRRLSDAERAEWASYVRQVRPLPGRVRPAPPPPEHPASAGARVFSAPPMRPVAARPTPLTIGEQPGGLDNASWQRLRTGRLAPTRKVDLHGYPAQRAFQVFAAFLRASHAERARCVEVVTGRGSPESGGVIRRELPLWLNLPELRPLVLAAAYPHPGNPGAVRLLLRRAR